MRCGHKNTLFPYPNDKHCGMHLMKFAINQKCLVQLCCLTFQPEANGNFSLVFCDFYVK